MTFDERAAVAAHVREVCRQTKSLVGLTTDFLRRSVRFQKATREQIGTRRAKFLIRRKLRNGGLSLERAAVMVGRPGRGGRCVGCELPLRWTELVMEIPTGEQTVYLHADCFTLWDEARCAMAFRTS